MANPYQGRYRIDSARLAAWDYSTPSAYFATICTQGHVNWLGRIWEGRAYVSPIGMILAEEWLRTPYARSDVAIDAWFVMPNHFHGILLITGRAGVTVGDSVTPLPSRLQPDSLGSIVGQIKSVCTKRIRDMGEAGFAWQPRYHDHIIRGEPELSRIREYIVGNPGKWCEDRYYSAKG